MKTQAILLTTFILIALLVAWLNHSLFPKRIAHLEKAYQIYQQAEQSTERDIQQSAFNQSLTAYLRMEQEIPIAFTNGKLLFNIGNCYFQLNEYPLAILYYWRAHSLRPNDLKVQHNLSLARSKLNLPPLNPPSLGQRIAFWQTTFSLPQRIQLFSLVALLTLLTFSLYIWFPKRMLKQVGVLLILVTLLFLSNILYSHFMQPPEAVLLQTTKLYRDAGTQYSTQTKVPLLAGSKVTVLSEAQEGSWLHIRTQNGPSEKVSGYIPADTLRFI